MSFLKKFYTNKSHQYIYLVPEIKVFYPSLVHTLLVVSSIAKTNLGLLAYVH